MKPQVKKLDLSPEEFAVLGNRRFFIVRQEVNLKLDHFFSRLQQEWISETETWKLPLDEIDRTRGKIFRGENYRGFPYTLMDFPRHFSKKSVFAIRSMCWWGHEFSFTLHLQGAALQHYIRTLAERTARLQTKNFWWCVNAHPWDYHFDSGNYCRLDEMKPEAILTHAERHGFIKLSQKKDLQDYESINSSGLQIIKEFGEFLK